MERYFPPFLSAYRNNYRSQNIVTSLIEEWTKNWDNKAVVNAVLTELFKAFNCLPQDLLMARLLVYNLSNVVFSYIY